MSVGELVEDPVGQVVTTKCGWREILQGAMGRLAIFPLEGPPLPHNGTANLPYHG